MRNLFVQNLINCPDGSKADPIIGCVQTPGNVVSTDSNIIGILLNIIEVLTLVAGSVAVLTLIWGGIVYATAVGDEDKQSHAKRLMFWATFGLIIALLARYVVGFLLGTFS